ncbi:hypothetical protein BGX38DRAFT_1249218 [Terfezia claveryi]|nr:hypothetical protein BGX38DRAFT_1249218 [Terfezia claveryi]
MSTEGTLSGKVIIIMGSSKGIGRAVALRLAKSGASVVINFSSHQAPANEIVKEIGSDRAIAVKTDVSKVESIREGLTETIEEDFDCCYAINVKGPYFLAQEAAKYLPSDGRLIFFSSSTTAHFGIMPNYLLYTSAKGAVEQMPRILAKDLGRRGITVNCYITWANSNRSFLVGKAEDNVKFFSNLHPSRRIGQPDDIAGVVNFLLGPEATWVNGQNIKVNGGLVV